MEKNTNIAGKITAYRKELDREKEKAAAEVKAWKDKITATVEEIDLLNNKLICAEKNTNPNDDTAADEYIKLKEEGKKLEERLSFYRLKEKQASSTINEKAEIIRKDIINALGEEYAAAVKIIVSAMKKMHEDIAAYTSAVENAEKLFTEIGCKELNNKYYEPAWYINHCTKESSLFEEFEETAKV